MNYHDAAHTRKTGLLSLIAEKKFQEGRSIGSSIGGAISEKFKAKAVGIKEKFDPLNMIRAVAGKGIVGKSLVTIAGRALGKDEDDIRYFGGYGSRKRKLHETLDKKDPLISTIGPGAIVNIRPGDGAANILAKMYNFVERNYETTKRNYELEVAFRKEQLDEDERRHKKLIEALMGKKSKPDDNSESFISKLLAGLKKTLAFILKPFKMVLGILEGIGSFVTRIVTSALGEAVAALSLFVTGAFSTLSVALSKKISKMLVKFGIIKGVELVGAGIDAAKGKIGGKITKGAGVAESIGGKGLAWGEIAAGVVSAGIATDAAGQIMKEAINGNEFLENLEKYNELKDTPENADKRKQLKEDAFKSRQKYQKDILIPLMQEQGYTTKKQPGEIERPEDFKNEKGEIPGVEGILSSYIAESAYTAKEKIADKAKDTFKDFKVNTENKAKLLYNDSDIKGKTDELKKYLLPLEQKNNEIPDMIPEDYSNNNGEFKDNQVSVINTQNNLGGGPPRMMSSGSTSVRNDDIIPRVVPV